MSNNGRIHANFFIQIAWVLVCAAFACGASAQEHPGELVLEFTGLVGTKGILQIALFQGESDYMQEDKAILYRRRVSTLEKGRLTIIPNLANGVYAVAVFQDLDENGQLNKNFLGIPTEPYGFSGEKGGKWGVPRFEQASFEIRSGSNFQSIRLHQF